jgi:hypothetical protein
VFLTHDIAWKFRLGHVNSFSFRVDFWFSNKLKVVLRLFMSLLRFIGYFCR